MARPVLIIRTLVLAYEAVIQNLSIFLSFVWLPVALNGAMLVSTLFVGDIPKWVLFPSIAFCIAVWVPPITAWHRYLILSEILPNPWFRLSFGEPEWAYLWRAVLFHAVFLLTSFSFFSIYVAMSEHYIDSLPDLNSNNFPSVLTMYLIGFLAYLPLSRFLLIFPAVAVRNPISLRTSWKLSKGNGLQLWMLYVLAIAPGLICRELVNQSSLNPGIGATRTELVLLFPIRYFPELAFFMIVVGALSFSYLKLVDKSQQ
jgi:hypothetical protein